MFKRQKKGKIIAGVCVGLSRFTGIDPFYWRAIFVMGTVLSTQPFLVIYILFWLITDKEENDK